MTSRVPNASSIRSRDPAPDYLSFRIFSPSEKITRRWYRGPQFHYRARFGVDVRVRNEYNEWDCS